jgi:hypothetical protein
MFLAVNPFFAIFFTYDVIGALGSELGTHTITIEPQKLRIPLKK